MFKTIVGPKDCAMADLLRQLYVNYIHGIYATVNVTFAFQIPVFTFWLHSVNERLTLICVLVVRTTTSVKYILHVLCNVKRNVKTLIYPYAPYKGI